MLQRFAAKYPQTRQLAQEAEGGMLDRILDERRQHYWFTPDSLKGIINDAKDKAKADAGQMIDQEYNDRLQADSHDTDLLAQYNQARYQARRNAQVTEENLRYAFKKVCKRLPRRNQSVEEAMAEAEAAQEQEDQDEISAPEEQEGSPAAHTTPESQQAQAAMPEAQTPQAVPHTSQRQARPRLTVEGLFEQMMQQNQQMAQQNQILHQLLQGLLPRQAAQPQPAAAEVPGEQHQQRQAAPAQQTPAQLPAQQHAPAQYAAAAALALDAGIPGQATVHQDTGRPRNHLFSATLRAAAELGEMGDSARDQLFAALRARGTVQSRQVH